MRFKMTHLALITTTVLLGSMAAQLPPDSTLGIPGGGAVTALQPKAGIVSMQLDMDATPVKGGPFCANVTTEHTQLFADGNRIHTTDNSTICRDSEGRTRREASLNLLGAAPGAAPTKLITIVDPVAGFRYMLDTERRVARKMAVPSSSSPPAGGAKGAGPAGFSTKGDHVMVYEGAGVAGPNVFFKNVFVNKVGQNSHEPAPATENLGDQTIEGIRATGTRVTTTIPSGQMGNEQPMVVTSERWYSPELKATVMTKHNDPWAGELSTKFTSVNTSEPDPSLFTVPSDYKLVDESAGPFVIQLPSSAPPK